MPDDAPIPADLLDLTRRHQAAMAATREAGEGELVAATRAEAALARELLAWREEHPEWATVGAQKRVRDAVAGE
ncbi:hypothetical protein RVR_8376 [Actinacidiphila reveromycinica]|uniref:Uncharacterized protein n=1 Tax=Actinacidiphila reveromycinica TaxID=659352 RepID=A0A7U3UYV7_9ACTN|nr:hypothetical protein [Streptomyces sp. SN-593]BBB01119.1 hypothetical protein RVR_8376 [Streptomyces sp. SN-593]